MNRATHLISRLDTLLEEKDDDEKTQKEKDDEWRKKYADTQKQGYRTYDKDRRAAVKKWHDEKRK
jgi:hypothetical protein